MKIAVFICDQRMSLIAQSLKKDADIIEIDEDTPLCALRRLSSSLDAVIFPVQGVCDDGFVMMESRGIYVAEFLDGLSKKCFVFTGKQCSFLEPYEFHKICWLNDETLLKKNADYTAEGILARLIEVTEKSIFDITIDIIGTGRCASSIKELFDRLKLSYRMITRASEEEHYVNYDVWKTDNPSDVIINTSPVCMMNQSVLKHWKQNKIVLDISSGAAGVDKKCMKHPFLSYYYEPVLPSRFCALSASDLIVNLIRKELKL